MQAVAVGETTLVRLPGIGEERKRRGGVLEHFHKTCSDELEILWTAVFLAFGCVSAQLQGCHGTCAFAEALPKSEPDGPSKILAAHRYIFYVNALKLFRGKFSDGLESRYGV